MATDPSWANAGWLTADVVLTALPVVPAGLGPLAKAGKLGFEAVRDVDKAKDVVGVVSDTTKITEKGVESGEGIFRAEAKINGASDFAKADYHGNDLRTFKKAQGYVLENRNTGEILKYGETTRGFKRYSEAYLKTKNANMRFIAEGSKREMHYWQHEKIIEFEGQYGKLPALNLTRW